MMVSSEMCCGFSPYEPGDWALATNLYLYELMSDINTGASAWIDWNMLLSWTGGPSYCNNNVKSPVILNEAENDFILTPIYDALKKFAKAFPAGSEIVHCEYESSDVAVVARKTRTSYVAVIANLSGEPKEVEVRLGKQKKRVQLNVFEIKKVTF